MNYSDNPIFITGCARSGTSLTAGIIHLCGAFGGKMRRPNINNQKGMFENIAITQDIVKSFLKSIGADKMGQNPLPDPAKVVLKANILAHQWRQNVISILNSEGYIGDRPFFYKGAKMCLMWEIWHAAFPNAQWIIVRRNKEDIIDSCLRTSFMKAYKDRGGWAKWVDWHERRFKEMIESKLNAKEIYPEKIILGDFNEIKTVVMEAGLTYNDSKVQSFISPNLWKGIK